MRTTWSLLELFSLLSVPQLLGVLAYFRVRKHHDLLAHLAGFLIPPVVFFFLTQVMLGSSVREIESQSGRVCGTYIGMMSLMILVGTGMQMAFSVLAQLALHVRHRLISVSEISS